MLTFWEKSGIIAVIVQTDWARIFLLFLGQILDCKRASTALDFCFRCDSWNRRLVNDAAIGSHKHLRTTTVDRSWRVSLVHSRQRIEQARERLSWNTTCCWWDSKRTTRRLKLHCWATLNQFSTCNWCCSCCHVSSRWDGATISSALMSCDSWDSSSTWWMSEYTWLTKTASWDWLRGNVSLCLRRKSATSSDSVNLLDCCELTCWNSWSRNSKRIRRLLLSRFLRDWILN